MTLFGNGVWLRISGKIILDLGWAVIKGGEDTDTQSPVHTEADKSRKALESLEGKGPASTLILGF